MSTNLTWHEAAIQKEERQQKNGYEGKIVWFTGLSASGKSTIANAFSRRLFDLNRQVYVLDGDNIRQGLNSDLGFGDEARKENIRRIGEVAKLFIDSGQYVLTAFISPFREDRQTVRDLVGEGEFIEVYVKCSIEACEERDPKGLYKKARKKEIPSFTGISSPYEEPLNPEIVLNSEKYSVEECVEQLLKELNIR
ncbi:MAG: adenylyl-sulfate kinase [Kurthia gibsonii]|uniref:Adenylyl-sulfate kinase n=1 Tax=Kurthia gibsonii TaxID=33946 RepID=A0ABU9LGR1_9BACL|nr:MULTISPECIES: adenylyl-sulfate kinase [Kurthia]AMA64031.1 adenylyl-sulfate kinase [Kurthia sp. 11kri321]MEB6111901.1 adenylyl-sulfate kinase [Kurthia gibsonii]RXH53547.1 adenylyl-sulfate kinase [Kurthia gibsonii]WIL39224.1 adenylyl-sulfate kinase [Kurthia sp. YJT4]HZG11825.1 adenylyl-sulfate kinase [Kurthia gibsonii]